MSTTFPTYDLIATCAFGLEAVVRRELEELGIAARIGDPGRVHFSGPRETVCQTNLWLRTADRVLIQVAQFPAADFDALFENARAAEWGSFLPSDANFPIAASSVQSALTSVPALQRAVKRAIVDAMRRDHGREELPESGPNYRVDVRLLRDHAALTIDTTGQSLHRRKGDGGLLGAVKRPPSPLRSALKETLAAAMVLLSFWRRDRPLIDPFCRSGTIPIEAALIGRHIAPGKHRQFAAEQWDDWESSLWQDAREHAIASELPPLEERLIGSDLDGRMLQTARENAARAGVAGDVHFQSGAMQRLSSKRRFGCLITYPPQGSRSEDRRQLDELYAHLPDVLRHLPTWSHYILTAYPAFEAVMGRAADRRRKLYNERLPCTYYQFHGPRPIVGQGPEPRIDEAPLEQAPLEQAPLEQDPLEIAEPQAIAVKPYVHASGPAAFGQLGEQAAHQAELFAARLSKRARHLRRWPTRRGITCYRLYERDIPEIPLVVDRYENHLHLTEYERPHDRNPAEHANWLDLMAKTAGETLDVPANHVFLKRRGRQRGTTQHSKIDQSGERLVVHEGGLKFIVNLRDYVDTGLFLDHRITRQMVREESQGKTFLNLFAYTGSFTVYAAAGGAKRTVSVDLSKVYLDWARDNLGINRLGGDQHQFIPGDIKQFIDEHPAGEMYDLVVMDPPTFSNSKRTEEDWDVQHDSLPLLRALMPLVRRGGVIYFSNNFRRFKFDPNELSATQIHEISKQTVPEDFRNQRIHRCWRIVK